MENSTAMDLTVQLTEQAIQLLTVIPTLLNLLFIITLILFGSYLGGYAQWSRTAEKDESIPLKNVLFGAAASFMCVPFFSSVIQIDYSLIVLPIEAAGTAKFIEKTLLLISVSGIASYLGYALLDGIAEKVLQQEIKRESEERKEQDQNILLQNNKLRAEIQYLKAITNTESAEKTGSKNLLNEALNCINEAITIYREDKNSAEYGKAMVFKGYILKRLGRIQEALDIVNEEINSGKITPITLYNKACYLYLLEKDKAVSTDAIKSLVREAITLETRNENLKQKQLRLKANIADDKENDLKGLFTDEERAEIASLECGKPQV
ncbi:hypothetical protein [Stutzerimonas stutzeri]|uniref:hypothetical protein n=1 Tax=Stutzerimonas stutzeri TaxID=316 RepID=UPI0020B17C1E|nr:hypothetical protein [Stutzerimonas stutzeri]MCP3433408.1 hypothetical protein [Stutzerimonas stutzeri]